MQCCKIGKIWACKTCQEDNFSYNCFRSIFKKNIIEIRQKACSSVTGIDCSWNLATAAFKNTFSGVSRKLPPLLAGNPVNYSKLNKLTTVEALAAAAYILGDSDMTTTLLDKFKWGHTFLALNKNILQDYSKAESESEIVEICQEYRLFM